jgi:hypothetical protein
VKNRFQSLPFKCNLQRYIADAKLSGLVSSAAEKKVSAEEIKSLLREKIKRGKSN